MSFQQLRLLARAGPNKACYALRRGAQLPIARVCGLFPNCSHAMVPSRGFSTVSETKSTQEVRTREGVLFDWQVGQEVEGFRLLERRLIEDFDMTCFHFVHEPTGAAFVHLHRSDEDNAFCVAFRTPPKDNSGVAHILEHMVTNGSQKHPVRGLFMHAMQMSLHTFMNAFTGPDYTMYPFSSQNAKDFHNLLDVYLNFTFFPLLNESDFKQEGTRIELEDPSDLKGSPLKYSGIVFNEMKGAMSDVHSIFYRRMLKHLCPSEESPYFYNSGGEPDAITDLTFDQLTAFHSKHYHPSNACFVSYGDLGPPLATVRDEVLAKFTRSSLPPPPPLVPRFPSPRSQVVLAPDDPMMEEDKQAKASVAWLCTDVAKTDSVPSGMHCDTDAEQVDMFGLSMLASLLTDGCTSPMYQALIESGLGHSFAPMTGFESSLRETILSVGVQGTREEKADEVEEVVLKTLRRIAEEEGFEEKRVKAILHQYELNKKRWQYGRSVFSLLDVKPNIDEIMRRCDEGPYFEDLIRTHILGNSHRLRFIMKPDTEYHSKLFEDEKNRLDSLDAQLNKSARERVAKEQVELEALISQEPSPDALATVPRTSVADIPATINPVEHLLTHTYHAHNGASEEIGETRVSWQEQPTNDIVFVKGLRSLTTLPPDLFPYLSIFSSVFGEMGTERLSAKELELEMNLHTGGTSCSVDVFTDCSDLNTYHGHLSLSSHALQRNAGTMLQLFRDVLEHSTFSDHDRLRHLLLNMAETSTSELQDSGHMHASLYCASQLVPSAAQSEQLNGISFLRFLHNTLFNAGNLDAAVENVAGKLQEVGEWLTADDGGSAGRWMVTGNQRSLGLTRDLFPSFLDGLAVSAPPLLEGRVLDTPRVEATGKAGGKMTYFAMPFQSNHICMSTKTVPIVHPHSPALSVLASYLSLQYLTPEIREKGGAYGAWASNSNDGVFHLVSYRNPNLPHTLDVFRGSAPWVSSSGVPQTHVDQAKLHIFSQMDTPTPPQRKGLAWFHRGLSDCFRQTYRDRLLAVTPQDLEEVAGLYLDLDDAPVAVLGDEHAMPKEITAASSKWELQHVSQ